MRLSQSARRLSNARDIFPDIIALFHELTPFLTMEDEIAGLETRLQNYQTDIETNKMNVIA